MATWLGVKAYVRAKTSGTVKITMAGAGAAGNAVLRLLLAAGARNVIVCDYLGAVHGGRDDLDESPRWIADHTNAEGCSGNLRGAVKDADVFVGVSAPGILTGDDIATMAKNRWCSSWPARSPTSRASTRAWWPRGPRHSPSRRGSGRGEEER